MVWSGMETCCHLAAFVSHSVCGVLVRALRCFDKRDLDQLQPVTPSDTSNLCCETGGNYWRCRWKLHRKKAKKRKKSKKWRMWRPKRCWADIFLLFINLLLKLHLSCIVLRFLFVFLKWNQSKSQRHNCLPFAMLGQDCLLLVVC